MWSAVYYTTDMIYDRLFEGDIRRKIALNIGLDVSFSNI
jgi:hypothetical protein